MIHWTTVISTVIGGFIAGIVGIFSALFARYLDRRERHLDEHKENFKIIDQVLVQLRDRVWPFHYGAEDLKLGHLEPLSDESLRYGILETMVLSQDGVESQRIYLKVDRELYYDIPKHFKELGRKLSEFEEWIKKDGLNLSVLLSKVSKAIYSDMYKSDLQVLRWTFDKGVKAYFRDLKGTLEEQEYAGVIFLILIKEDEKSWPNTRSTYEKFGLYNGLEIIAEDLRHEIGEDTESMLSLFRKIDELEKKCHDLLEKEEHELKLKGHCKYARF